MVKSVLPSFVFVSVEIRYVCRIVGNIQGIPYPLLFGLGVEQNVVRDGSKPLGVVAGTGTLPDDLIDVIILAEYDVQQFVQVRPGSCVAVQE